MSLYKSFCKEMNYLQGVGNPGINLLFKTRSGSNGLPELGTYIGKNDDRQCENVVHVLCCTVVRSTPWHREKMAAPYNTYKIIRSELISDYSYRLL